MSRFANRPTRVGIFRSNELARLMTMIVMLGVIAMLMSRARDPANWKFLAGGVEADGSTITRGELDKLEAQEKQGEQPARDEQPLPEVPPPSDELAASVPAEDSKTPEPSVGEPAAVELPSAETRPPQPERPTTASADDEPKLTDEDPEERDAAREGFEPIVDKQPLAAEDMFAYWRFIKWSRHQTAEQMLKRARKDLAFAQIFSDPANYRGKLIALDLHLRQALEYPAPKDAALNLEKLDKIYQLIGYNDDSNPYHYMLITDTVPREMPLGKNVMEEGTFVGYFLKLVPYEDHTGKHRAAPVVIGQFIRRPSFEMIGQQHQETEQRWAWIIGGGLVLIVAVRMVLKLLPKRTPARPLSRLPLDPDVPRVPLETWLSEAQSGHPAQPSEQAAGEALGDGEPSSPSAGPPHTNGVHQAHESRPADREE